jgi:SAM-dependent methyltransferase
MNLGKLTQFKEKPTPFAPGEAHFWDDPYISRQMLEFHLDPNNDHASRRPETIDQSVSWLVETLEMHPGMKLIDLGCGPGLYATRFAERGISVTGIDLSRNSIEYAEEHARQHNLPIQYRCENYLDLQETEQFDVALLIYGDFCPLSAEQRNQLMKNVHRALLPGGYFVLDVTTRVLRKRHGAKNGWYISKGGFWKPGPHLVLEEGFDYPELSIYLDQYIVIQEDGKISVYRNWFQDYSRQTITTEIEGGGFEVKSVWSDLTGTPYTEETEWIGVIAQKV